MIAIRPANERGSANFGWLDSRHTFSFGSYYDPQHMDFGALRVINEDKVAPGQGFGTHGHRNMEIISYVLSGALEHKDSIGNGSTIRPGDVQRMSAGTGIQHSEYNASSRDSVHFLQIWIQPDTVGIAPGYEQKHFELAAPAGSGLMLVGSRDGREGSVTIHQDVNLYAGVLSAGQSVTHEWESDRAVWLHVAQGGVKLGDRELSAGDGAAIVEESGVVLEAMASGAEVLLFDFSGSQVEG